MCRCKPSKRTCHKHRCCDTVHAWAGEPAGICGMLHVQSASKASAPVTSTGAVVAWSGFAALPPATHWPIGSCQWDPSAAAATAAASLARPAAPRAPPAARPAPPPAAARGGGWSVIAYAGVLCLRCTGTVQATVQVMSPRSEARTTYEGTGMNNTRKEVRCELATQFCMQRNLQTHMVEEETQLCVDLCESTICSTHART